MQTLSPPWEEGFVRGITVLGKGLAMQTIIRGWQGALTGAVLSLVGMQLGGCAASRALDKPSPKNYGVLKPGSNRDLVRAELGQPQQSVAGSDCDLFAFEEGSSGWKYMRAIGYSLLDIGTLGISEVVTNPAEAGVGKDRIRVRVCYDKNQNVTYSERLEVGKPAVLMTGKIPPAAPKAYTVSGGISGLAGTGLTLQLNGAQNTTITDNGAFFFQAGIQGGAAYTVSVLTQPVSPSQTCSVARGASTMIDANVSNVLVSCTTNSFVVWGQVAGLQGKGLVLQNNGADDLAVAANGAVKFGSHLQSGSAYAVSVLSQPADPTQVCTVANGSGKVGNGDVMSVTVDCVVADAATPGAPVPAAAAPATN